MSKTSTPLHSSSLKTINLEKKLQDVSKTAKKAPKNNKLDKDDQKD